MQAVKQGSAVVGLRSDSAAVLVSLKRSMDDLASYQQKVFKLDEHMGIGISGVIADARILCRYMRNECLNHRYLFESGMDTGRLVVQVADKAQRFTQRDEKRPYGVGLLVIGYDKTGPHVYETSPSGNYFEWIGQALGARSQAARTYLENCYQSFKDLDANQLIQHGLTALAATSPDSLEPKAVEVAVVGKDTPFRQLNEMELRQQLQQVQQRLAANNDDQKDNEE